MLVFPEGRKGTEKLYKDRYRLRRFGRGGFVEAAMRAQAPIVPVCVVGRRGGRARLRAAEPAEAAHRAPLLPAHAHVPALRPARDARLPAGQVQAALPRADPLRRGRACRRTRRSCRPSRTRSAPGSRRASSTCSRKREVGVVRMTELATDPRHRPVDLLGRPARPGARGASQEIEAIIGVDSEEPQVELERTEFVKVGAQHALLRRVVEAAEIDTVVDTRLVVDSVTTTLGAGPREQRDRDDEHPRRLRGPGLAGPQGGVQVLDPLLRVPSRTTRRSSTRRWAARTRRARAIERDIVEAEAARRRLRRASNPDVTSRSCASRTCSGPTCAPRTSTCSRCRPCR